VTTVLIVPAHRRARPVHGQYFNGIARSALAAQIHARHGYMTDVSPSCLQGTRVYRAADILNIVSSGLRVYRADRLSARLDWWVRRGRGVFSLITAGVAASTTKAAVVAASSAARWQDLLPIHAALRHPRTRRSAIAARRVMPVRAGSKPIR
jgi:hypothetical protein